MTLILQVSCDGYWDGMPCRGALSAWHTAPLNDELRDKATRAGWALTDGGDYCPAHARKLAEP